MEIISRRPQIQNTKYKIQKIMAVQMEIVSRRPQIQNTKYKNIQKNAGSSNGNCLT